MCLQRYEIDHFCSGICQPSNLVKYFLKYLLEYLSNDYRIKTDFEIYGSSIGVCNYVIQFKLIQYDFIRSIPMVSNQSQFNPFHLNAIEVKQSMNEIKCNMSIDHSVNQPTNHISSIHQSNKINQSINQSIHPSIRSITQLIQPSIKPNQ